MDALECIANRYSYRHTFKDVPVPREDLEKILIAGLQAPSGCNKQTTEFIAVDDPAILDQLRKVNSMPAVQTAPVLIFCLIDRQPSPASAGRAYQVEDAAAAVQNMLLSVTALGYASIWVQGGLSVDGKAEAVAAILGVPSQKLVFIMLPVGVPQEQEVRAEKLPLAARVSYNGYKK